MTKKLLSVLLVFVLLIPVGSSVLAYDSATLSNEGSNDNKTTESFEVIGTDGRELVSSTASMQTLY
ncbi:hypothetical protein CVD25_17385 [Bacillus canaveralius]|uniref:Uncharacterized protein n=1 Tax=Bacillus canaveralius TaxID=1403243 RepID=A0A2N5GSZ1_9BACI|nr:hypothetical protein CU635_00925 [Bacillus canaveralius]PLR93372.1 hypothetical protein CVD25_17385 [Bacillus canaveralius]